MKDFEYLRNISIGQYIQKNSPVHNMHPGMKLTLLILLMATALVAPDIMAQLFLFLQILVFIKTARLSIRFILRGMLPALPYLVFIGVLQLLFIRNGAEGTVLWTSPKLINYRIIISVEALHSVSVLFARFFNLMGMITLFSATTNTNELTNGVEQFLSPLKIFRFPAHEAALILAITFRFIPILGTEAERIAKAQAARGADLGTHKGGPVKRIVRFFPILLPLFQNALDRAEELIEAMETKCYTGGKGRTSLITFSIKPKDIFMLMLVAVFCTLTFLIGYTGIIMVPLSIL